MCDDHINRRRARSSQLCIKSTYMHIQVTRHAKHKTRLDKTPRRDMRRHTYTTNTARQAQQDKHKTRLAHIKTGTTRQAQAQHDKHNMTSTPTGYRRSWGLPSRSLHSWDWPIVGVPWLPRGGGPSPSRHPGPVAAGVAVGVARPGEEVTRPVAAGKHGQYGVLRRGSGQDRRGAGRQTSCCRNSVCRPVCWWPQRPSPESSSDSGTIGCRGFR